MNTDIEQKRKRIETIAKVLGLGLAGFIVAPVIFLTIKGIIGLIVTAAICLPFIYATPAIGSALANWRLKLLKAEAARNPVETLQNDYVKRQEALVSFAEAIKKFIAEKESFAEKLDGFKTQYPTEAPKFALQLGKMEQLLTLRKQKYKQAQRSLELYESEIQKAGAIWEMGQAAAQMSKAAGMSDADFFAKIQVETALDSVQKNLNIAFADLEVSLLDENESSNVTVLRGEAASQLPPPDSDDSDIFSKPTAAVKPTPR